MAAPNVLVTGSSGHLGYALMLELPGYGYSPIGIDILPSDHTSLIGRISDRDIIAGIFARHPSIRYVLHAATLHKPHVGSHTKEEFIETNVKGTLVLLEEASKTGRIDALIFTSTTSTFGSALAPKPGQPAAWIDETVTPIPKNIYGATKVAAEDICQLVQSETKMPTLVLKTSRFFPEPDDNEASRLAYNDDNLKVNELLYRRADISDIVSAHICAMKRAKDIGWGKYIISAPPPFERSTQLLSDLDSKAPEAIKATLPRHAEILLQHGWKLPDRLDRVYDSSKAVRDLEWKPMYTFEHAVDLISQGLDYRSDLTHKVGKRGYHAVPTGVYTF
ncbi:UDP-glucose 4-epimerase [Pseudocercospora fuligena]|uniref:UDP-glucose 4-epimerase n=1 Tax=Pseudocercospora fuligena TaxID=685502 RepID=A0A8H6REC2_9PEZI|nr:UDP-glucose 4-epimerase [Pseudocercospora fuligena]